MEKIPTANRPLDKIVVKNLICKKMSANNIFTEALTIKDFHISQEPRQPSTQEKIYKMKANMHINMSNTQSLLQNKMKVNPHFI